MKIFNVPLTPAQTTLVESWSREVGRPLAEEMFVLAHAHNGERWVPLNYFARAESKLVEAARETARRKTKCRR